MQTLRPVVVKTWSLPAIRLTPSMIAAACDESGTACVRLFLVRAAESVHEHFS